jgi:phosphoglycerate kinase
MKKLRIDELPVEMIRGNRVFVLINGTEPEASLPTLSWLLDQSARIILGFHSTDREAENMDLRLSAHLGRPVRRIPNVIGPDTSCAISQMTDQSVVLLENLHSNPANAINCPEFASALASLCDVYCDDAFDVVNRGFAANLGITRWARVSVAGLDLAKTVDELTRFQSDAVMPSVAIVGGSATEEKFIALGAILPKVNRLFIGGQLAFTFMKATGLPTGAAPIAHGFVRLADRFLRDARPRVEVFFPEDFIVVESDDYRTYTSGDTQEIRDSQHVFDIQLQENLMPVRPGSHSLARIQSLLEGAKDLYRSIVEASIGSRRRLEGKPPQCRCRTVFKSNTQPYRAW